MFRTCGGMSSRSHWVCLPWASLELCWDTALPLSDRRLGLPPARFSGSWRWIGQGSPATSKKTQSTLTSSHCLRWAVLSCALRCVHLCVRVLHTDTNDLAEQKSANRFYKHPGFGLSAGQECLPSVIWEQLLTILCNVVAWIKPSKAEMTWSAIGQKDLKLLHCLDSMKREETCMWVGLCRRSSLGGRKMSWPVT